eukprot:maker-scaffold277_size226016-snap-gene-0.23 protein:Tk10743 transcript:maker-scaffold277_size226016-snap-gene-0.23-mRNA-1 annotation:"arrestin domain-containing protein 3"
MRVNNLRIIFDNSPYGVYFPGQTIHGRVQASVSGVPGPTPMRGVHVKFTGRSRVLWSEQETQTNAEGISKQHTVIHSNHEVYFTSTVLVTDNWQDSQIYPGDHFFPFTFNLPQGLPSSFEGSVGQIRYSVKATMDRKNTKAFFTINGILDLNHQPGINNPVQVMDHKNLCCFCCRSGPISAVVRMPKTGFVPGEVLVLDAEVENKSSRTMNRSQVRLMQIVKYRAVTKSQTEENRIVKIDQGEIPAAPPSYEDAVGESRIQSIVKSEEDDDDQDTEANWEFVPRYVTYRPRTR